MLLKCIDCDYSCSCQFLHSSCVNKEDYSHSLIQHLVHGRCLVNLNAFIIPCTFCRIEVIVLPLPVNLKVFLSVLALPSFFKIKLCRRKCVLNCLWMEFWGSQRSQMLSSERKLNNIIMICVFTLYSWISLPLFIYFSFTSLQTKWKASIMKRVKERWLLISAEQTGMSSKWRQKT